MYQIDVRPMIQAIRIYDCEKGQSWEGKTPYCTVMVLAYRGMGECQIDLAHGELSDEINRLIIQECIKMGYRRMFMDVPHGSKVSRYARDNFIETYDGLDRYMIDLEKMVPRVS